MKALGIFLVAVVCACAAPILVQRFIQWREDRHWERTVFDPSWKRAQIALEDMIEGASK